MLVEWPEAPLIMKTSLEIDAYPGNIHEWEAARPGELASEEINALFGWKSAFHDSFGFYIDGVDETTATLPPGWRDRAVVADVQDGDVTLHAVAPRTVDVVVAKLHRLHDKDRGYIEACHFAHPLDLDLVWERLLQCSPPREIASAARAFLDGLSPTGDRA